LRIGDYRLRILRHDAPAKERDAACGYQKFFKHSSSSYQPDYQAELTHPGYSIPK